MSTDSLELVRVESVKGFHWKLNEVNERLVLTLIQKYNLPEIVARVLSNKIDSLEMVEGYLEPKLRDFLPDPFHLIDMEKAANRIVQAIEQKERVVIYGDYDVDGATSSALLKRFFASLGIEVGVYIPDRMKEGYGPNIQAFEKLKEQSTDLVITVDCGTMSFEPIEKAKELGFDVIVIDHHLGDTKLPEALAIVNPNRLDEKSEYRYLAAVGVSFLLAVAVNKKLKEIGKGVDSNFLLSLLDIVALGTVCDVVPLKGLNRAFVAQGLKVLSKRQNTGLTALSNIARIDSLPTSYHLGFVLGPRINAGGRVGESSLGSELLSTNDPILAEEIARQLEVYNSERKAIEMIVLDQATIQAESIQDDPAIIIAGHGWHPGVIGIVAGRLKETYNKPVAVISLEGGVGKASCRSVKGVDFGSAVISAKIEGLLEDGGGHAMAAGFTVLENKIDDLKKFLCQRFAKELDEAADRNNRSFEGYLSINGVNLYLAKKVEALGPFGAENYEPRFMLKDVFIAKYNIFGNSHIRAFIASDGMAGTGKLLKANAFKAVGTKIADILINNKGAINVVGYLRINRWRGMEMVEFQIEDIIL